MGSLPMLPWPPPDPAGPAAAFSLPGIVSTATALPSLTLTTIALFSPEREKMFLSLLSVAKAHLDPEAKQLVL